MKLFTKGLLLIAIPGAIELALLGFVYDTQHETVRAAQVARDSRQVLYQASSVIDPLMRQAARVRTGMASNDAAWLERRTYWVELEDRLARLATMVADTPPLATEVKTLQMQLGAYRASTARVAATMRAGGSLAPAIDSDRGAVPPPVAEFRDTLDAFMDDAARVEGERRAALAHTRTLQQVALIAAVLGSMLTWGIAAMAFARSVGRRLDVLIANAEQLGRGRPLASPLQGNDELAALDAVMHDTGARLRAAEYDHVALKARLETRAEELARANEALRKETQDNELFIYSVSHDLRSPLVNLQGFSKELQVSCDELRASVADAALPDAQAKRLTTVLDGDMHESLRFLRLAVTRASAIIEALLRMSRAGRLEYQWQRVSVARTVARVVDSMQDTVIARSAVVKVHDLPSAWGDPLAIEQIFRQLTSNALNYLDPSRGGRIEIGALPEVPVDVTAPPLQPGEPAPPRTRTYYVRDNGLGIPAAYLPKMFRAFQRLHGEVAEGEGVGLAMVRRMTERHGGRVWVESAEGSGSTFFIVLPQQSAFR